MAGIIDTISVTGKVVLISGAGHGIGRTYARRFARAGARVAIADINAGSAAVVAAEIVAEDGRALAVTVDVGAPDSVRAALGAVEAASLAGFESTFWFGFFRARRYAVGGAVAHSAGSGGSVEKARHHRQDRSRVVWMRRHRPLRKP